MSSKNDKDGILNGGEDEEDPDQYLPEVDDDDDDDNNEDNRKDAENNGGDAQNAFSSPSFGVSRYARIPGFVYI